jgi:hypothetical protein
MVNGVQFVYVVYVVSEALAACSFNLEAVNGGAELKDWGKWFLWFILFKVFMFFGSTCSLRL